MALTCLYYVVGGDNFIFFILCPFNHRSLGTKKPLIYRVFFALTKQGLGFFVYYRHSNPPTPCSLERVMILLPLNDFVMV
jgi:hypothetical protein